MDLYTLLRSSPDGSVLRQRVGALRGEKVFGESLTVQQLRVMLGPLEDIDDDDDCAADINKDLSPP